jgi:hypothetical protein
MCVNLYAMLIQEEEAVQYNRYPATARASIFIECFDPLVLQRRRRHGFGVRGTVSVFLRVQTNASRMNQFRLAHS